MSMQPMLAGAIGDFFSGLPWWWYICLVGLVALVIFFFWYRKRQV